MLSDIAVQQLIQQGEKLREAVSNHFTLLRIDNIKQIRELIKHFILISSGIIGFSLPIFGTSLLIKTPAFLVGGMAFHLVVVLYGFYYLAWLLQQENNSLAGQHQEFNKLIDKFRDNNLQFIQSTHTEADVKLKTEGESKILSEVQKISLKRITDQRFALDLIFWSFFFGLAAIAISITDTNLSILYKVSNMSINNEKTSAIISLAVAIVVLCASYFQWWTIYTDGKMVTRTWVKILLAILGVALVVAVILIIL